MLIAIRDEAPLVCRAPGAPDVSEHCHFGTCHIGTSANSALIRYYLLRLKLSSSTRDRGEPRPRVNESASTIKESA